MRVLHIMATGATSGGANHLLALLPALQAQKVEVAAAVGSDGPLQARLQAAGIAAAPISLMRARLDPLAPQRLRKLVDAHHPDLVHVHGTRAAFFASLAKLEVPWVYTVHGLSYRAHGLGLRKLAKLRAEQLAMRAAAQVISVSQADLDDLEKRGFVSPERARHIPNPIDLFRFSDTGQKAARAALQLSESAFVVGTVARLVPGKAIDDLLVAATKTKRQIVVLIAGDGPERQKLEALAQRLKVPAVFLGERNDVATVLSACDLFALTSRWEGEPIALLEALAVGRPCVATRTSGAIDLLAGTAAGTLVPVGDPKGVALAIDAWRAMPQEERTQAGAAGRALVTDRDPSKVATAHLEVYTAVLASLGAAR